MRRVLLVIAGLLAAASFALVAVWVLDEASTPPIAGDRAIAEISTIDVAGVRRSLLVRGEDRDSPVLLFLHEPFGWTTLPFSSATRTLERSFVVVHWDQRGAGSSDWENPDDPPEFADLVADLREFNGLLRKRFGRPPIVVAHGASLLTALGVLAEDPEAFAALVVVSPLSDPAAVLGVGPTTDDGSTAGAELPGILTRLQRDVRHSLTVSSLLATLREAPEYTWPEKLRFLLRLGSVNNGTWNGLVEEGRRSHAKPSLPVFAFLGGRAAIVPAGQQRAVASALGVEATRVVSFDESGYHPMLEEPERFTSEMEALRETVTPAPR